MDKRKRILEHALQAHSLAEQCYLEHTAAKGSPEWLHKRRYLLADLSLHMVHAALEKDSADPELIKRYLYSILTISNDFLPGLSLTELADKLVPPEQSKL